MQPAQHNFTCISVFSTMNILTLIFLYEHDQC